MAKRGDVPAVRCVETKWNDRGNVIEWTATCLDCKVSVKHIAMYPTLNKMRREHLDKKHPGHPFSDW